MQRVIGPGTLFYREIIEISRVIPHELIRDVLANNVTSCGLLESLTSSARA
jgi:hypothetical protein